MRQFPPNRRHNPLLDQLCESYARLSRRFYVGNTFFTPVPADSEFVKEHIASVRQTLTTSSRGAGKARESFEKGPSASWGKPRNGSRPVLLATLMPIIRRLTTVCVVTTNTRPFMTVFWLVSFLS